MGVMEELLGKKVRIRSSIGFFSGSVGTLERDKNPIPGMDAGYVVRLPNGGGVAVGFNDIALVDPADAEPKVTQADVMTFDQLKELLSRIYKRHSFGSYHHSPGIKYVRPQIDMRDGKIFSITMEGDFGTVTFNHNEPDLYGRIIAWIDEKETSFRNWLKQEGYPLRFKERRLGDDEDDK